MPEWLEKAIEYGLPLLSAIAGYVGAAKRFAKKLDDASKRLSRLQDQVDAERASVHLLIDSARRSALDGDEALKAAFRDQMSAHAVAIRESIKELERDLGELEEKVSDGRERSAGDHSTAAALARDMLEVREQCLKTHAALNLVLGYLKAGGARI